MKLFQRETKPVPLTPEQELARALNRVVLTEMSERPGRRWVMSPEWLAVMEDVLAIYHWPQDQQQERPPRPQMYLYGIPVSVEPGAGRPHLEPLSS